MILCLKKCKTHWFFSDAKPIRKEPISDLFFAFLSLTLLILFFQSNPLSFNVHRPHMTSFLLPSPDNLITGSPLVFSVFDANDSRGHPSGSSLLRSSLKQSFKLGGLFLLVLKKKSFSCHLYSLQERVSCQVSFCSQESQREFERIRRLHLLYSLLSSLSLSLSLKKRRRSMVYRFACV